MAFGFAQIEEEAKEKVLNEPHCSSFVVMHDSTTLYLYKAGGVMEMDSNSYGLPSFIAQEEPKYSVVFTAKIVIAWFYVRASNKNLSSTV